MTQRSKILFVQPDGDVSRENAAALAWLEQKAAYDVRTLTLSQLASTRLGRRSTLWFHWTKLPELDEETRLTIDAHVWAGGGLLATLGASELPVRLGWESNPPDEIVEAAWMEDAADEHAGSFSETRVMRGLQSFRGHPLFEDLGSGAYTWAPERDEPFVRYAYTAANWPVKGRTIAVEKSFISMNPDRRLAWEQMVGDGWALCIGGYVYFAASRAAYRAHLERVIENALRRVMANGHRARLMGGAWAPVLTGIKSNPSVTPPPALDATGAFEPGCDLVLEREATESEYTLAGSRCLLVGREATGHEEIWVHPFRAVSRWTYGSAESADDTQQVRNNVATQFRIQPGVITRRLTIDGAEIDERTTVAPETAATLVELRPIGGPVRLSWSMETDLRLMWPYPAGTAGRISVRDEGGAVGLESETGEWLGCRIDPAPEALRVIDVSDDERSRVRLEAELNLTEPTRILIVGATADEDPPETVDPADWASSRLAMRQAQQKGGPAIHEDHPDLADAVEWAKWRVSTYRVEVPGLGTSLVAGYGRSRRDEFGDGRPGYAWFFGRDACWTALACLDAGQHETVREVLQFLGRHQDITGKILHECTTSGVIHYDAADSTPLYLLLAARYLAATGDRETVEREWPRIMKAYEFCLDTDTDGDGLIENTGVGHGWVEFGRLGENHVSFYLAGVWTAALAELEVAARTLGYDDVADELAYRAAAARASLELSFFDPIIGRYAHGRRADGSLNTSTTVMTAVPLLLGTAHLERCESWLDEISTPNFSTEWGVRLVPRSDSEYRSDGYHAGSVWPLFTGWVSLAEARAGRKEAATRHWEQIVRLYKSVALGAWPEVLHGDELRSVGVTTDQAWSTAMALAVPERKVP
jgi:hypothetical protein